MSGTVRSLFKTLDCRMERGLLNGLLVPIFVRYSLHLSSTISLLLNLNTASFSPQYNLVHDFAHYSFAFSPSIPPELWDQLISTWYEHQSDTDGAHDTWPESGPFAEACGTRTPDLRLTIKIIQAPRAKCRIQTFPHLRHSHLCGGLHFHLWGRLSRLKFNS